MIYSRAALELSSRESLLTCSSKALTSLRPGSGLPSCLKVKLKEKNLFFFKKKKKEGRENKRAAEGKQPYLQQEGKPTYRISG